ncbi:MAG: hypothetical protein K2G93_00330, partial [Rikenella sp.]|nr:hypothetical protein [Rikenella sp.]
MIRKIVKYSLIAAAILFGSVVAMLVAVYLPPVQDFVKRQAIRYVSENLGMQLEIERLRLRFPLQLAVDDAQAVTTAGDTLFRCGALRADVALWPLVRGEVVVREFRFGDASFHLNDTTGGMELSVRVREFGLTADQVEPGAQTAHLPTIRLSGGDVRLRLGQPQADTVAKDTASAPLLWQIVADRLLLEEIAFSMHSDSATDLRARIGNGQIDSAQVDLSDLTIRAARLRLADGGFRFDRTDAPTGSGFDPNHIDIQDLQVGIDSVFNRGSAVRATLRELAFVERSGLAVRQSEGGVAMDSTGYRLSGFRLQTDASVLRADLSVGSGIASMEPTTPLRIDLKSEIGTPDLFRLVSTRDTLRRHLDHRTAILESRLAGTLADIQLRKLFLSLPNELDFNAQGEIRSITAPERANGRIAFDGRYRRSPLVAAFLPAGITLPPMQFRGEATAETGNYRGKFHLRAAEGTVDLDGSFVPADRHYTAALQVDSLPLFRFLPSDSAGYLTLTARADGHGFDLFSATTEAQIDLRIAQAEYQRFDYRNIALAARLTENRLNGRLTSDNEGLGADLSLTGHLTAQRQEATLSGNISRLDLERLRLTPEAASASLRLDLQGSATDAGAYAARLTLDSLKVRYGTFENSVARTVLSTAVDTAHVEAEATSGDLRLTFRTERGIDSLSAALARTAIEAQRQIQAGEIDADTLGDLLPPFRLTFRAARNNLLSSYLRARGMGFSRADLTASAQADSAFDFQAEVNQFSTQGLFLDTLTAGVGNRHGSLHYFARLANRPGNRNRMKSIALYGHAAGRTAQLTIDQRDRTGRSGVHAGLRATLADSAVTVNLIPRHPIFGFAEWSVNDGNYVRYGFDRRLTADLRITRAGQAFTLQSTEADDLPPGSIRVGVSGIDIDGV